MSTQKTTGFLYNGDYGGFDFSEECKSLYKKETGCSIQESGTPTRTDPILIGYFLKYGSEWMSGDMSKIYLFEVDPELLPFVSVEEYDGLENPYIDHQKAKLHYLEVFLKKVDAGKDRLEGAYAELKDALELLKK